MDKQTVLYSNRMQHKNWKEQTTNTYSNTDESQTHNAEQKKLDTKENILYDSIYIYSFRTG